MKNVKIHVTEKRDVDVCVDEVSDEAYAELENGCDPAEVIDDFWDMAFAELDSDGESDVTFELQ